MGISLSACATGAYYGEPSATVYTAYNESDKTVTVTKAPTVLPNDCKEALGHIPTMMKYNGNLSEYAGEINLAAGNLAAHYEDPHQANANQETIFKNRNLLSEAVTDSSDEGETIMAYYEKCLKAIGSK